MMQQKQEYLSIATESSGLINITNHIIHFIEKTDIAKGLITIYSTHTSASLLIQENADRDVQLDIEAFFHRLVPQEEHLYSHTIEGKDDMPAHIKTALTQTSLLIPITEKKMSLGKWQGIYLFEHRTSPHVRKIVPHIIGEP